MHLHTKNDKRTVKIDKAEVRTLQRAAAIIKDLSLVLPCYDRVAEIEAIVGWFDEDGNCNCELAG